MVAPTYVGEVYESSWTSTTSPKTSTSISVTAGDLLVAVAGGSSSNGALTVSDSAGLTWTPLANTTGSKAPIRAYYATVATTGTLTVTVTRASGSSYWGFNVVQLRNHGGVGATNNTANGSGAPSFSFTTTAANSAIVYINGDISSASSSGTWRSVNGAPSVIFEGTPGATFHAATWTDAGTAGAKTLGLSSPSQDWSAIAVEVLAQTATPIAGSDTGTLTATETAAMAVLVSQTGSDSGTVSAASETATLVATQTRTDSGTLAATEARTLAATSTRTDSGTIAASEVSSLSINAWYTAADSGTLTATETADVRRTGSRADLVQAWDSVTRDSWPLITRTADWEQLLNTRVRTIGGWGELVDAAGRPVQVMSETGRPQWRLPLSGASVTFDTENQLSFSARLAFSHPWMVPTTARHPLWGASPLRIRLWWAIWNHWVGAWWSKPVCTVAIGNTSATDSGTISGTVDGRDLLSTAVGYGRGAPSVAGMTIDKAIGMILTRSAPALQSRIAPTSVIVPEGTVLQDPQRDLEELSAAGYPLGVARTDDVGIVHVGPRPSSTDAPLAWQEGSGCPVSSIDWVHGVTAMGNEVTVVSSHPDAVGLVVTRTDDDPTSPTFVGGPWGSHPLPVVSSSVASTLEALGSIADAELDRGLHPTEDVRLKVPQRPDLYGWRPAHVVRQQLGVAAVCQISSWTLELPVPGVDPSLMDVGMMQRRV